MYKKKEIENKLIVLLYHGVTKIKSKGVENYSNKHISESDFIQQMKYLNKNCNVISIDDVVDIYNNNNKYPKRAVVITFDDCYRNNFEVAAPILDDLKIPATFYISSGMVNTDLIFWMDIIEDCINLTKKNQIKIKLDDYEIFNMATNEHKIKAINKIKGYCKTVYYEIKDRIVEDVIKLTEVKPCVSHSKNYENITWDQVCELDRNDLFTIGGHSLYHNILANLSKDKLEDEIIISKKLLEYHLNKKICHYSYPEGQEIHYNEEVISLLKNKGIICCPSAIEGLNKIGDDLFHLKRIMVGFMGIKFPIF